MTQPVLTEVPDAAAIRDELQTLVLNDLLGPLGGPEEEFGRERPTERYLLGRLAPEGEAVKPEEQDDLAGSEPPEAEEGTAEPPAPNVTSMSPSALGCTVYVDGDVGELAVTAWWGSYEIAESETGGRVWRRVPWERAATLKLRDGVLDPVDVHAEAGRVQVRGRARRHDGRWLVSIFLVNHQARPQQQADTAWLFQAGLTAAATDGAPVFSPRPERVAGGDAEDQAEQRRLAMSYRLLPQFAVGHGVAVHAVCAPGDPTRAVRVETAAVPQYEIPTTDVPSAERDPDLPELAHVVLDMAALADAADASGDALATALTPLVEGYRRWIGERAEWPGDQTRHLAEHHAQARAALDEAGVAADRIDHGIAVLRADADARRAFAFANRAMHAQRVHTLAAGRRRSAPDIPLDEAVTEVDHPGNRSWRPFQLAFILLNLPALTDPRNDERADDPRRGVADLLWFPTGGGKTEAYLGLTAYALAIRRRQADFGGHVAGDGVAVLMRYTLRLLTIQQFQRATALICACERLRADDPATWGDRPMRIGLWVGGRVTPNTTDGAIEWLKERRGARGTRRGGHGSPFQLTSCPWCGAEIDPARDISVSKVYRRTSITCPDAFCPFGAMSGFRGGDGQGLPVLVVDEEIYRHPPALLIGTVDKFAQLPWKGETRALFGRVDRRCDRHGYLTDDTAAAEWESPSHRAKDGAPAATVRPVSSLRPPDLIIQDELHLISGPLGSLTGLYETAVDQLATWELPGGRRVRPKVIASTATVRRAPRQIDALFHRSTRVFPPQGIDADDSYFARQRPTTGDDGQPGRRYVGLCAHGTRVKSSLIRVYVSVLGAAQKLHEKYGRNEVTDPYMTLVGYFNSLRDLGGMRRLVDDDVTNRLRRATDRGLARRLIYEPVELTSRRSSEEIPKVLDQLGVPFRADRDGADGRPIDVLLATNMIAVGVDVPRLGAMVVAGQPKSTAEYIQATSRVGRRAPGIIFTLYNWSRPRDLSHYENFEHFHATVYRSVEALSVTPFAHRAIDRGLTGVLVALVRNLEGTYNGNRAAQDFDRRGKLADHAVMSLRRRAGDIAGTADTRGRVEKELEDRLAQWERVRATSGTSAVYGRPIPRDGQPLLHTPDEGRWRLMTCPTSLRDVEPGIRLLLDDNEVSDLAAPEPPFEPVTDPAVTDEVDA